MSDLRAAAQQALEALEREIDTRRCKVSTLRAMNALRAALAQQAEPVEPVACEPQYANDDGWCEWVCPKPRGYLMQCCDCDLIHEVESRVAKYQPRPSEEFEVVDDPDLQVQWRMKRRDDISPKQKTQEPVAWRFEARHIDSAWGAAVSLKHPGPEGVYMRNVMPLYTAPPQRKPLTEEEILMACAPLGFAQLSPIEVARAIERAHGIGGQDES
jgi:hypothetical protein